MIDLSLFSTGTAVDMSNTELISIAETIWRRKTIPNSIANILLRKKAYVTNSDFSRYHIKIHSSVFSWDSILSIQWFFSLYI